MIYKILLSFSRVTTFFEGGEKKETRQKLLAKFRRKIMGRFKNSNYRRLRMFRIRTRESSEERLVVDVDEAIFTHYDRLSVHLSSLAHLRPRASRKISPISSKTTDVMRLNAQLDAFVCAR